MEEKPSGQSEEQQRQEKTAQPPSPPSPEEKTDTQGRDDADHHHNPSTEQQEPAKPSRFARAFGFFSKSDWVMVILTAVIVLLTAVIAGTGVVGIILVIQGGKDTERIRDAAEKQACAAQHFADTAVRIRRY